MNAFPICDAAPVEQYVNVGHTPGQPDINMTNINAGEEGGNERSDNQGYERIEKDPNAYEEIVVYDQLNS